MTCAARSASPGIHSGRDADRAGRPGRDGFPRLAGSPRHGRQERTPQRRGECPLGAGPSAAPRHRVRRPAAIPLPAWAGRYEALNCGTPDDASGEPAQPSRVPADILPPEPIGGVLPSGVHFAGPDEIALPDEIRPSVPDREAPIGSAGWSRPIVFQTNGKTCDLRLRLLGQDGHYVDVKLRGLTGSVKVGHVGRVEDGP